MKKIDIGVAYQEMSKCKRPIAINNVFAVFTHVLKDVTNNSPIFIENKKALGEAQYNVMMNTLVFSIISKCMELEMPKDQYQEFIKTIMVEEGEA